MMKYSDFLIAEEGLFGFGSKKDSSSIPDYNNMTNEDIAKRMCSDLRKASIKLHDESDPNTKTAAELTCLVAKHEKIHVSGALVIVSYKNNEAIFSVWGSGPYIGQHRCISTKKSELIRGFIKDDKRRKRRK